jgi:hypothetical protein
MSIKKVPKGTVVVNGELQVVMSKAAFAYSQDLYSTDMLATDIFTIRPKQVFDRIVENSIKVSAPNCVISAIPITMSTMLSTLKRCSGIDLSSAVPSQMDYELCNEYDVDLTTLAKNDEEMNAVRTAIVMLNTLYFSAENHPVRYEIYLKIGDAYEALKAVTKAESKKPREVGSKSYAAIV